MKKILSVLLAVCLLAVCLPLSASAEVLEGSCGDNAEWLLDTETGVLTISGTGPMKDYQYYDDVPWAKHRKTVKSVVVNPGITHIGGCAFWSFENKEFTTAELPSTVTSIGRSAFAYCKNLVNCNLPDGITVIGEWAFLDCAKLQLKRLPASLTTLCEGSFKGCASIGPAMEFPEGVTAIPKSAFECCEGIKQLTLREGIGDIGSYAFRETSIQKVVIPSTAQTIGGSAFEKCEQLRFVDMKGGIAIGSWAFSGCTALEKINLPNSLTKINGGYDGYTFYNCPKLTYLYIPGNVVDLNIRGCGENLKTVCIVNPACKISWDVGVVGKTTIYGEKGSTAESFAKSKGYSFKELGAEPKPPADPVIGDDIQNPSPSPSPSPSPEVPQFTDVKADAYFYDAVAWAVANGITNGSGVGKFGPNNTCTRGQIVTFLWRAAGEPKPASAVNPFTDVKTGDYFYKAVLWAREKGITDGTDATHFSPTKSCTRGQAVTFLWRAKNKPTAGSSSAFGDVAKGSYYENAVNWAVANGVTNGAGAGKFDPNGKCTRGQIVTFLHRSQA